MVPAVKRGPSGDIVEVRPEAPESKGTMCQRLPVPDPRLGGPSASSIELRTSMRKLMHDEVQKVLSAPRDDSVKPCVRDAFMEPDGVETPDDLGHLSGCRRRELWVEVQKGRSIDLLRITPHGSAALGQPVALPLKRLEDIAASRSRPVRVPAIGVLGGEVECTRTVSPDYQRDPPALRRDCAQRDVGRPRPTEEHRRQGHWDPFTVQQCERLDETALQSLGQDAERLVRDSTKGSIYRCTTGADSQVEAAVRQGVDRDDVASHGKRRVVLKGRHERTNPTAVGYPRLGCQEVPA